MLPELLAPYASVTLPASVSDPNAGLSMRPLASVPSKSSKKSQLSDGIANAPVEMHNVRNCMTICQTGGVLLGYGNSLFSLKGSSVSPLKTDISLEQICEVVSSELTDSPVACVDLNGQVECLTLTRGGQWELCFQQRFSDSVLLATSSQALCISDKSSVQTFDIASPGDPICIFPEGGGPVAYSPETSSVIYHGDTTSVGILDLREGLRVSSLKAHPACISLTAYTFDMDYQALAVHRTHQYQLVAFSNSHKIIQLFDVRNNKSPVTELALPGRENLMTPRRPSSCYHSLAFNSTGERVLWFSPLSSSGAVFDIAEFGKLQEFSLSPPRPEIVEKTGGRGRPRTRLNSLEIELCIGLSWDVSGAIISFSNQGNVFTLSSSEKEAGQFEMKQRGTEIVSRNSLMQGMDRIMSLPLPSPAEENIEEVEKIWIKAKVGLLGSLKPCARHPLAHASVPGSFLWNECVMFCKPDIDIPKKSCLRTSLSKLSAEFAETFHRSQLSRVRILEYLRSLEEPALRIVNEWTVEVSFEEPLGVPAMADQTPTSRLMVLESLPDPADVKRNRVINKDLVERLRSSWAETNS